MSLKTWKSSAPLSGSKRSKRFVFNGRAIVVLRLVNDFGGGDWVYWQVLFSYRDASQEATTIRQAFLNARKALAQDASEEYAGIA